MEIFRGTELRVSGCVQVENTDKKFRERIMNPGGARRGRGRECIPVGPSIHSPRPSLATFCQGILNRKIFRYTPGWWLVGRPCPPSSTIPSSPRSSSHHFHRIPHIPPPLAHPFTKRNPRANDRRDTNRGEARDRSFAGDVYFFVRSEYSTSVGNDFEEPMRFSSSIPSSSKFLAKKISSTFFAGWRGEGVFFFFFLSFLTTSSRESSNKARLIFSGSYSNLPLYAAAFLQGGKECRNPSPKGMLLFHGGIRV